MFWALIEDAKAAADGDLDFMANYLRDQLVNMSAGQAREFHYMVKIYSALADKRGLWSAASIIKDGCTDDGFTDFRLWLIAQGKEVFFDALKDPDTLASLVIIENETYGKAEFCDLDWVGDTAYEALTGMSLLDEARIPEVYDRLKAELSEDVVYADGMDDWIASTKLPNLSMRYKV